MTLCLASRRYLVISAFLLLVSVLIKVDGTIAGPITSDEVSFDSEFTRGLQSNTGFEPDPILKVLHNSTRFGGGNKFKFPVNISQLESFDVNSLKDLVDSPDGKYYVGVIGSAIAMFVVLLLWLVLLCSTCCTQCNVCCPWMNDACLALFLVLALSTSAIGWFYSISGNRELQSGFSDSFEGIGLVETNIDNAVSNFTALDAFSGSLTDEANALTGNCTSLNPSLDPSLDSGNSVIITQFRADFATFFVTFDEPSSLTGNVRSVVTKSLDIIQPVIDKITPVYIAFTASIISFLGLFTISTVARVMSERNIMNCQANALAKVNKCFNSIGVCLLYSIGFSLVITVFILAAVMSAIAKVGADLCIEDLTGNLEDAVRDEINNPDIDLCTLDLDAAQQATFDFASITEQEVVGNLVCNYGECRGFNVIFEQLGLTVTDDGTFTSADIVDVLNDSILSIQDGGDPDCIGAKSIASSKVAEMRPFFENIVSNIKCQVITPVYDATVNDKFCNGIVSGIGIIYMTWTTGAAGMMLGMYLYLLLDEDKKANFKKDVIVLTTAKVGEPEIRSVFIDRKDSMDTYASASRMVPGSVKTAIAVDNQSVASSKQSNAKTSQGNKKKVNRKPTLHEVEVQVDPSVPKTFLVPKPGPLQEQPPPIPADFGDNQRSSARTPSERNIEF